MRKYIRFLPTFVLAALSLTPILWFLKKGNVILNGVDINFPLDPIVWFSRRFFIWNSVTNAGSDFSSSTAGLFFHLIQLIPYILGFALREIQLISLIFWFGVIIFSSFTFVRLILPGRKVLQILFVILYSFNIYLFNSWENIKVANLSLVASIPLGISIILLLNGLNLSKTKAALYSFFLGILVSGAGINPSYIVTFILALFIFSLSLNAFKNFLFVIFFVILANLFWILPTFYQVATTISPSGSIDKIGFTNWVQSLSGNTSLLNVMRLQGAWDWYAVDSITGLPLYISYALNYFYKFPFIVFSFILTAIAISSFLLRDEKRKYLYITFGLMFVIGIFLGAGTHPPTGVLFFFLSSHIPFFTLFRSPWYIFTPLVTLSLAGLISLFFYSLGNKLPKHGLYLAVLIIIGNFFYSYPLITGKIFRYNRPDSFFVSFPKYVYDTQKWLQDANLSARVVSYPDDEIENFTWGYRGIESILSLLSDSEILFSSLNMPDSPVSKLIKELYWSIKRRESEITYRIASKLNAGYIFEKSDQLSLSPSLPEFIKILPKTAFDRWSFYELDKNLLSPKIYTAGRAFFVEPYNQGQKIMGFSKNNEVLLNPNDTVVAKIPGLTSIAGRIIMFESSQFKDLTKFTVSPPVLSERLITRDPKRVIFDVTIDEPGSYSPILERYKTEDFGLNAHEGLDLLINGTAVHWEVENVSDSYTYFKPVSLSKGSYELSIALDNRSLVSGGSFEEEPVFEKFGKGKFQLEEAGGGNVLGILNVGEGAPEPSANFKIERFDPMQHYLIQIRYRQIYGNNASVVVLQSNTQTLLKAQTERLPNYPEWNSFSFYYEPLRSNSEMKIALVAPFTADPLGTKVFYDNLTVYKVFSNGLFFTKTGVKDLVTPKIEYKKINPVKYEGGVEEVSGPHLLVFSENYSRDWEMTIYNEDGKKLDIAPQHFSANTYANAWYVDGAPQNYSFKIYNKHQNLFWLGLALFLVSILLICLKRINILKS